MGRGGRALISMASVDYCERCRCKTLHVPLPNGERACEYHLPEPELGARTEQPVKRCGACSLASPGGTLHHVGCGVGAPPAARFVEVTCHRCGKTLSELGVNLGEAEAHYLACRGAARARAAARGYVNFAALFWVGIVAGVLLGACGYCVASYAARHVDVKVETK